MFCSNCGTTVPEGSTFCTNCGAKMVPASEAKSANEQSVNATTQNVSGNVQPGNVQNQSAGANSKSSKGNSKKTGIIALAVALVVVVIGVFVFITTRPVEINLNEYIEVKFEGYDTVGQAEVKINESKLAKDFGEKIKYRGKEKDITTSSGKVTALMDEVSGKLDKESGLKNGDKVVYKWKIDEEELKKNFNVKLVADEEEFKVKNLKKADSFDPFEGLECTFDGISPNGRVNYSTSKISNKYYINRNYYIQCEKTNKLANGDEITFYITQDNEEKFKNEFVKNFGGIPTAVKKTVKVEGLDSYVASFDEISKESLETLQKDGQDYIRQHSLSSYSNCNLKSCDYVGAYYLTNKNENEWNNNKCYVMFKVTIEKNSQTGEYYYGVVFNNLVKHQDGKVEPKDGRHCSSAGGSVKFKFKDNGWEYTHYFTGFESLEVAKKTIIDSHAVDYNATENMAKGSNEAKEAKDDATAGDTKESSAEASNASTEDASDDSSTEGASDKASTDSSEDN